MLAMRAYETAQRLSEQLDMLGMGFEAQVARDIRGRLFTGMSDDDAAAR